MPCGGVPYGDANLAFIANDWHTALLPLYLQVRLRRRFTVQSTGSLAGLGKP